MALIEDDKIGEAPSTIRSVQKVSFGFSFYKAYCLYRQNKLDEALDVLEKQTAFAQQQAEKLSEFYEYVKVLMLSVEKGL